LYKEARLWALLLSSFAFYLSDSKTGLRPHFSFVQSTTSLMRSITAFTEGNFIYGKAVTSFTCACGNDVSLQLNDVACTTQTILCLRHK
jgi:hypothetical protein